MSRAAQLTQTRPELRRSTISAAAVSLSATVGAALVALLVLAAPAGRSQVAAAAPATDAATATTPTAGAAAAAASAAATDDHLAQRRPSGADQIVVSTRSLQGGHHKLPRGYCARIQSAIAPSSRCFRHLVIGGDGGRSAAGASPTAASASSGPRTAHRLSDSTPSGNPEAGELVYVRLETVGADLANLNTRKINEHLLQGVLNMLLGANSKADNVPNSLNSNYSSLAAAAAAANDDNHHTRNRPIAEQVHPADASSASAEDADGDEGLLQEVRAQIADSPPNADGRRQAERCRLSVEKFVCRLAYPSCHFRRADVSALVRPPCREDCLLLRNELCPNLNWFKFSRALRLAINSTLKSSINALDLAAEGDLVVVSAQKLARQSKSPSNLEGEASSKSVNVELSRAYSLPALGYNLNPSLHFYWPHERSIERCESLPPLRPLASMPILLLNKWQHFAAGRRKCKLATDGSNRTRGEQLETHHKCAIDAPPMAPLALGNELNDDHRLQGGTMKWPVCSNSLLTKSVSDESQTTIQQQQPKRIRRADVNKESQLGLERGTIRLSGDGANYQGVQNHTLDGYVCQNWSRQWPHRHKGTKLLFDNMKDAHNYCRNPGGLELKPWCYTMNPDVRWQYCNIENDVDLGEKNETLHQKYSLIK